MVLVNTLKVSYSLCRFTVTLALWYCSNATKELGNDHITQNFWSNEARRLNRKVSGEGYKVARCLDGNNLNIEASIVRLVRRVAVDLLLNPLDGGLIVWEGVNVAIPL